MSSAARLVHPAALRLESRFAREFPELSQPWRALEAAEPQLLALNEPLARELGLDPEALRSPAGLRLLTGFEPGPDAQPVAQAYAGHQFGGYSPRLGDGRALLLGEFPDGRDLHLKGTGPTPFSRGGDGLAAIGPMLREFLISESLHALGVPTTRTLAVVATGGTVMREQPLPGAVLARVAASHLRVGSFQYARANCEPGVLRRLANHAIARHYPQLHEAADPYLELFRSVVSAQAKLVAQWMLLGFVHGVLNTDNTTISGEGIDYGPCAFMERYDVNTVFSSIDHSGRYRFGNQPAALQWNLARFAESLIPLIAAPDASPKATSPAPPADDPAAATDQARTDAAIGVLTAELADFGPQYRRAWESGMRAKLGLAEAPPELLSGLEDLLGQHKPDLTGLFCALTEAAAGDSTRVRQMLHIDSSAANSADAASPTAPAAAWLSKWLSLGPDPALMARVNPLYIPRNLLVEEALEAATGGDMAPFAQLASLLTDPYQPRPGCARYTEPAPLDAPRYVTFCGT